MVPESRRILSKKTNGRAARDKAYRKMEWLTFIPALAWLPIVFAFAANMAAELLLAYIENRFLVAFAKSIKAIIIPALIATYALVIANIISTGNMNP